MIGRRSFPFGEAYFQGAIPVLGRGMFSGDSVPTCETSSKFPSRKR